MSRKRKSSKGPPTERAESRLLVSYAFDLARQLGISKILVLADLLQDRRSIETLRKDEKIIWVVRGEGAAEQIEKVKGDSYVEIPETEVGRMDQVKLGLIMSVLNGAIDVDESLVCLTGVAGSKRLDNLLIANPGRDFPGFAGRSFESSDSLLASSQFARLLDIALRFGKEGREGKPIGTTFVLGDPDAMERFSRPLIMNPLKGHGKKVRNIQNAEFLETLRELASLDGAFIVGEGGVVESAGVYLDAPLTKSVTVPKGLGARHTAAAAVSAKADAVAIVVSESSGTISVFSQGSAILEIGQR